MKRPVKRRTRLERPSRDEEPALVSNVAAALADGHPLALLALVSSFVEAFDAPPHGPPEPDLPSHDEFVQTLLEIDLPETSAMLAVVAEFLDEEMLQHRIRREIISRVHALPHWLAELPRAKPADRVVEVVHVLGDGENVIIGVHLPDGYELTAVIYIDRNLGTLVKDAFVVPEPVDELVERMLDLTDDPDTQARDLDPADARARIIEAITRSTMTYPEFESDTWPACRPLLEWAAAMLPPGGTGYQRPEWDDTALAVLTADFLTSPFGAGLDDADHRSLLEALLWFGTDYGPGDPLRWSPTTVKILLGDWLPRKILGDAAYLAKAPDLLRAFIGFCHHERGIRAELTTQTLDAVDEHEPDYQRVIRSARPQGPAALLAAMGGLGPMGPNGPWPPTGAPLADGLGRSHEIMLDTLRRAVGGEDALNKLDATPLPDEPFATDAIPADVHDRVAEVLALVDRFCDEFLDTEYRTACRRFLARAAAGDPEIFRRRSKPATAAAAVCWVIGKANMLFDPDIGGRKMLVKDLAEYFGVGQSGISQRSVPLLRAIGVSPQYNTVDLGSTEYLTSARRARIIERRDFYQAMD